MKQNRCKTPNTKENLNSFHNQNKTQTSVKLNWNSEPWNHEKQCQNKRPEQNGKNAWNTMGVQHPPGDSPGKELHSEFKTVYICEC